MYIMKKLIKKYGNTLVVNFNVEDRQIVGLREGDIIDFEINNIKHQGGKKR